MSLSVPGIRRAEIPALTSLRYFAALWVVLFHVREIGLWHGGVAVYRALIGIGYVGVSFFFVLSGFILVYVYGGREVAKRRFWQARFARIYPAYLFSLLVTLPGLLHFLPVARQLHLAALTLTAYPLLLEAWFPRILMFWNVVAWSLSVEVFFYAVFPFALRVLERMEWSGLRVWIVGSWFASLLLTGAYIVLRPDGVAHTTSMNNDLFWLGVVKLNPLVRLPEFLLGMGVGAVFLRVPARARSWPIAMAVPLLLLAIALQTWIPYPVMHSGLLAPVFALLIFGFATRPAWSRFLAFRPLMLLGEASYSLYLLHSMPIVILAYVFNLARSPHIAVIVAVYVMGMSLVSIAVFLLIENPCRRLLRPRRRVRAGTEASGALAATR